MYIMFKAQVCGCVLLIVETFENMYDQEHEIVPKWYMYYDVVRSFNILWDVFSMSQLSTILPFLIFRPKFGAKRK
jgi:hypothetical protein